MPAVTRCDLIFGFCSHGFFGDRLFRVAASRRDLNLGLAKRRLECPYTKNRGRNRAKVTEKLPENGKFQRFLGEIPVLLRNFIRLMFAFSGFVSDRL